MLTAEQVIKQNQHICSPITKNWFLSMAEQYRYIASRTNNADDVHNIVEAAKSYELLATKC